MTMELWGDARSTHVEPSRFDEVLGSKGLVIDGVDLLREGRIIGKWARISEGSDLDKLIPVIGTLDWLVVEFDDWSMIPLENLISMCQGSGTRIATVLDDPLQATGAAFALQHGVDALIVPPDGAIEAAARIAAEQRSERSTEPTHDTPETSCLQLSVGTITAIESGHMGDRVCIDLIRRLGPSEGALIGSSAGALVLVHGETRATSFVPPRPFRINAGPLHAYVLMEDGTTRYLSELRAGDSIMVIDAEGRMSPATIGRLKIEPRPHLLFGFQHDGLDEATIMLQHAETVRVVTPTGPRAITELRIDDTILISVNRSGRHLGRPVKIDLEER